MPDLSTISKQQDFLVGIGERLYTKVSPGDANDWYGDDGDSVFTDQTRCLAAHGPCEYIDAILARWIGVQDVSTQLPVPCFPLPAQRHVSSHLSGKDIILKSGKVGFTTYFANRHLVHCLTHIGCTALLIAHKRETTEDLFGKIGYAMRVMPDPIGKLREGVWKTDIASSREIKWPGMESRYYVETAGDKAAAVGESLQLILCTEVSRWERSNPKQVLSNLFSHMVGDQTRKVLESRPHGDFGEFYDMYWASKRGENGFKNHFYQWWWAPNNVIPPPPGWTPSQEILDIAARYKTWRQNPDLKGCGLHMELPIEKMYWRFEKGGELTDLVAQEFAEDETACFMGSGDCPFPAEAIQEILERKTKPVVTQIAEGESENGLWFFKQPEVGKAYIVFCDPAGGQFTSRTAIQVIDYETGEQVAEYAGRPDYQSCGGLMKMIAKTYNNALLVFENNMGRAAATIVTAVHDYNNLYWHVEKNKPKQLGWPTDANRDDMIDGFGKALLNNYIERNSFFKSVRLAQEVKTCERRENRIQHKKGHTDDLVLAMAGALAVRKRLPYWGPPAVAVIRTGGKAADTERGWNSM